MEPLASARAAMRLLAQETGVTYAPVPPALDGFDVGPGRSRLSGDRYLLHSGSGYRFLYERGVGVRIEIPAAPDPAEEALWFNGSVYAAVASINGLMPIHASAVAHDGRVFAFTGPSGAGKSTLVAALGARGLPMFCDDTLVLDLSDPNEIVCLPGHKRLKLSAEALRLTGAVRQEKVAAMIDKFYAAPPAGDVREPLPLARLTFLEDGSEPALLSVSGAERFARLSDDHHTAAMFAQAQAADLGARFALFARLAPAIPMSRLIRPRDAARFDESVTLAAELVTGQA